MLFAEIIKARTQTLAPIAKGSCQPSKARMTEGLKSNFKNSSEIREKH